MPVPPNDRPQWSQRVASNYATAVQAIQNGHHLIRRVSDAERAHYEVDSPLVEMFPNGVEPIKVFSIDRRFRFGDNDRNFVDDSYCVTMAIPITPKLEDYFTNYFYPDNPGNGRVPAIYRGNPAFKVEHNETTIVIRREGWEHFWGLVDDVDYTPGFHTHGQTKGF